MSEFLNVAVAIGITFVMLRLLIGLSPYPRVNSWLLRQTRNFVGWGKTTLLILIRLVYRAGIALVNWLVTVIENRLQR